MGSQTDLGWIPVKGCTKRRSVLPLRWYSCANTDELLALSVPPFPLQ